MSLKLELLLSVLCLLLASSLGIQRADYRHYPLYKVYAEEHSRSKLIGLRESSDAYIFLQDIPSPGYGVHVVVAPHKAYDFEQVLRGLKIEYQLVEKSFDNILRKEKPLVNVSLNYDWHDYYTVEATIDWMTDMAEEYSEIATLFSAGQSSRGGNIVGMMLSWPAEDKRRTKRKSEPIDVNTGRDRFGIAALTAAINLITWFTQTKKKVRDPKPGVLVEAGIHGNEWITSAAATYIIEQLLHAADPIVAAVIRKYDWYIIPHVNPEGHTYADTTDPLWRKTVSIHGHCFGVDANRNWAHGWKGDANDITRCLDNYPGPKPFSVDETRTLSEFLTSIKSRINLHVSLHSLSKSLEFPYGYVKCSTEARSMDAINTPMAGLDDYDATGSFTNWTYHKAGVLMSCDRDLGGLELPNTPRTQVPTSQIIPTSQQLFSEIIHWIIKGGEFGAFNVAVKQEQKTTKAPQKPNRPTIRTITARPALVHDELF